MKARSMFSHCVLFFSHKWLPRLFPWDSFSWSPDINRIKDFKEGKCRSPLSLSPHSKRCIKYVWQFFSWQQFCSFLTMYIHQLLSSHHWEWLLGSNYLIFSRTSGAHLHRASLSIDRWLIAPKLSCREGMMILTHQVGQHWSTGWSCKGTTAVALH